MQILIQKKLTRCTEYRSLHSIVPAASFGNNIVNFSHAKRGVKARGICDAQLNGQHFAFRNYNLYGSYFRDKICAISLSQQISVFMNEPETVVSHCMTKFKCAECVGKKNEYHYLISFVAGYLFK